VFWLKQEMMASQPKTQLFITILLDIVFVDGLGQEIGEVA
jgi:hypothetical protein